MGKFDIDLSDERFAEAAFYFVQDPYEQDAFVNICFDYDLSIMEYIEKYRRAAFLHWLQLNYPQLLKSQS